MFQALDALMQFMLAVYGLIACCGGFKGGVGVNCHVPHCLDTDHAGQTSREDSHLCGLLAFDNLDLANVVVLLVKFAEI